MLTWTEYCRECCGRKPDARDGWARLAAHFPLLFINPLWHFSRARWKCFQPSIDDVRVNGNPLPRAFEIVAVFGFGRVRAFYGNGKEIQRHSHWGRVTFKVKA